MEYSLTDLNLYSEQEAAVFQKKNKSAVSLMEVEREIENQARDVRCMIFGLMQRLEIDHKERFRDSVGYYLLRKLMKLTYDDSRAL